MKSESEIRRHRDNLRTCQKAPCGCKASGHSDECQRGGEMMRAVEHTLSWLLDEAPEAEKLVAELDRDARRIRAEGN